MNLWHLKTFCAVYENRSFTRAAEIVHRTQPSISSQIAELEKYYGTQLFIRKGRDITPTESGETLYKYAQRILKLAEQTKEVIDDLGGSTRGQVAIGGSTIPGTYILPRLLSEFRKDFSGIEVSVRISDTKTILEHVLEGQLEVGIVGKKISDTRFDFKPLAEDRIVLTVPAHSPLTGKRFVTIEMLRKESLIFREEGSGTRGTVEKELEKKGWKVKDQFSPLELGGTEAVKNAVIEGLGVAFLSQWSLEREKKLKLISEVPVRGLDIRRRFHLVTHRKWPLSRATKIFMDFCLSRAVIPIPGN